MTRGITLDASGLTCPQHVLVCKAKLARLEVGEELRFVATDRGSPRAVRVPLPKSARRTLNAALAWLAGQRPAAGAV
ncbi:MAG: sulfurtransferase TusA family protein [Gammaproteobacteria bacterium]